MLLCGQVYAVLFEPLMPPCSWMCVVVCLQVLHMDLVTDEIIQNIIFIAHAIWQCLLLNFAYIFTH